MSLFGPLFRYELTRLARRGTQPKLRAAFAGLLLIALFLAYLAAFPETQPLLLLTQLDAPMTLESASRFGERFLVSFLFIQVLVVLVVTPAIASGAIGEDKERGALDLLLTTELSSTEILLGKMAARLVFVGSLLFTGLPVVTLVIFFGGVDIGQLVAGYAISAFTILSLGAISVYWSVMTDTLGAAMTRSYLFALVFSLLGLVGMCFQTPYLSPLSTTWALLNGWLTLGRASNPADVFQLVGFYAGVHVMMAVLFVWLAARGLRLAFHKNPTPTARRSRDTLAPPEHQRPIIVHERSRPHRNQWVPRVFEDNVFGWKERYFGGFLSASHLFSYSPGCAIFGLMALGCLAFCLARVLVVPGLMIALLIVGLGTAASVARERQRGTLDALLMLPRERTEMLWAKLLSGLRSGVWVAVAAIVFVVLGVPLGVVAFPAYLTVPIVFAGWMPAAGGFGLWLSVRCPTVQRAVGYWFFGAFVISILPALVAPILRQGFDDPRGLDAQYMVAICQGFSPPVGVWYATASPSGWERVRYRYDTERDDYQFERHGAVIASLLACVVGFGFVWLAARDLDRNE